MHPYRFNFLTDLKKLLFITIALLAFGVQSLFAQQDKDLVQLSGLVLTQDSLKAVPLVSIRIKGSNKGTLSDEGGFFSFVVRKKDTIVFSALGYRMVEYVVPADLRGIKYSIIQPMSEDTFFLPETVIRPYPTPEEFDYYFVKATMPDPYYEASTRNLRRKTLENIANNMDMNGSENANYAMQQQAYRYYYNGQLPPNRIFDPIAWSQFFEAWKRGDYSKKKKK